MANTAISSTATAANQYEYERVGSSSDMAAPYPPMTSTEDAAEGDQIAQSVPGPEPSQAEQRHRAQRRWRRPASTVREGRQAT